MNKPSPYIMVSGHYEIEKVIRAMYGSGFYWGGLIKLENALSSIEPTYTVMGHCSSIKGIYLFKDIDQYTRYSKSHTLCNSPQHFIRCLRLL